MIESTELHVHCDDLAAIVAVARTISASDGQAILAVEHFALTANNMTYAAHGVDMGYWKFYPAPDGFGIVPVWGFARVVESRVAGLAVGERFYGYWPMASHAVLTPGKVSPRGFIDLAEHRQGLARAYNSYTPANAAGGDERLQSLLRPLFMTGFLLALAYADALADKLILTSASSKTALAMAQSLNGKKPLVGLTSAANVAMVEATGYFDAVHSYDDLARLSGVSGTTALIDFSGNGALRLAIHELYGDRLLESVIVGDTNWDAQNSNRLPGVAPTIFFAPTVLAERTAEWGADGFEAKLAAAWDGFIASAAWLTIVEGQGPDAVVAHWHNFAAGRVDPTEGVILTV